MSSINNPNVWIKIDDTYEEAIIDNIRFVREINDIALSLDCPICKTLICCIEDVEFLKKENCCENCYNNYSLLNKENSKKTLDLINNKK